MRRRIYTTLIILLSVASIAVATFVAAYNQAPQSARTTAQKRKPSPQAGNANRRPRTAQRNANRAAPVRAADASRAPQPAVDDALYTNETFFGVSASVARPYSIALGNITALAAKYPKDARLHLHAARLSERLSQFDKAASEMRAYADLKGRTPDALRRLADFYHDRAMYADEVKTLQDLAKAVQVNQREPIYKRAATLVRTRSLKQFNPADFFAELVAADPSNVEPVKVYVEELTLARQYAEALAALESFQPKFPSELAYFLKTRAQIHEARNDRRRAEEVYSAAFDPNWPQAVASDYYDLLRRFGRYRLSRRGLQDRVRGGANDLETVARLFNIYAYEGSYQQAAQLLVELEGRRANRGASSQSQSGQPGAVAASSWTASELETAAGMFTSIGHYDQASRYLYTLYLTGGLQAGSASREEALYRLFKVMIDAAGTPTRVAGGDLSFYRDVAEVDQHPGFMNGVLSLVLSGTDPAQEFAAQEKNAAGYFNRAFAYRIFTAFKQEYARSRHLGDMYLAVVNVFAALGEHRLAVEAGREFQERYPDSARYTEVSLQMADSYVALKDRASERAVLASLLDRLARATPKGMPLVPVSSKRWAYGISPRDQHLIDQIKYKLEAYSDTYDPTQGEDDDSDEEYEDEEGSERGWQSSDTGARRGPTYSSVLERYVASLAADDKKTETIAMFWAEIKKHPKEEGLYERFLRWLGEAEIINEQLKAYNTAIREFDSNTWYHRLARWYVRQKRGRELARYSRQLIDIFDEEEITDYLLRFAGYGATGQGDELNWDQQLAFDLYSYAHNRFKRNLFFVRGMLTHLEASDRARWEKLSTEYYFADRSIRDPLLAWLSKQKQLREKYQRAVNEAAGAGSASRLTYSVFAADAALWLSHHDEAISAYRRLIGLYPGEPQYADRLADLTRSFGHQDPKLYEESAQVSAQMAEIYPTDHTYRIEAGEVYAELGDFKRAGEQWDKLVALEPGNRETYLEVATVYWDYYQYDQALRVFKELRNTTGDQTIYAYRVGAVYEGKGDIDSAIAEYMQVLPEAGEGRDTVAKRLAQLSRRKGLAEKITAVYGKARAARPDDWHLVLGFAAYQAERDHQSDALAMLRTEVSRSTDVAFLESVRDLFRAILRPEDERQVIERLAVAARDEREAMAYRLQLASFLERQGQKDAAINLIDKLTADYPTNLGVIEEAAGFYWRAGLQDRSLDLYKRTLARARGASRRSLTLQLARRQMDAARLGDAEATLRAYYNDHRFDTEMFGELARTLSAANKLNDLQSLYQEAFKDARESGLGADETLIRMAELRAGMIRTLAGLGKHQDALDQHIEIINTFPEDADRLADAIDYAESHSLLDRLTAYYEKLSKESYKNYRWQLVLGRIYERQGNLAGAAEQYRTAVTNEPQRSDLRLTLASVLARQRRYDEALVVLREGWALSGRDPQWLIEAARVQAQQGRRDEAVQTLRQALASKKNATAEAQLRVVANLSAWGLDAEAVRIYEQIFARLPKTLKDEIVSSDDVAGYVRAIVRVEPVASAFQKIERMREQFKAIANNSRDTDGYKAANIVEAIDQAMRSDFGRGVIDYANAGEITQLTSSLRAAISRLTLYTDRGELLRYLGIARGANLFEAEEQIHKQLINAALVARANSQDTTYYNETRALVAFYNRHAAYARAAELLAGEYNRDQYKDRFDYQNQIAIQYRLAGDRARELEWLRAAYRTGSGNLTPSHFDWVERYLDLLHSAGMKEELAQLALAYSPHQIQLINFLIEKNERALARTAIANAKQSAAWVASRSGEVGLFLKDTSPTTESFFKSALDIRPIGEMIGRRVDASRTLVGDDWFTAARNYGFWLGLVPARESESRSYVPAEIEGKPVDASAQIELAAYYLSRKEAARAGEHLTLAAELAPGDKSVIAMRGSIALARGDRKGALEAWATLLKNRATFDEAQSYLRVMADNGFLREALPELENFIVTHVNRQTRGDEGGERAEALKPLVRDIARRIASDQRLAPEAATFFHKMILRMPSDLTISRLLVEEALIPESALASIYRTHHSRLSDVAAAVAGTAEYEDGYWNGSEHIYPARALAEWRRRLIDYLIRAGAHSEARLLITAIRQEQADLSLRLSSGDEDSEDVERDRYEWLPLASALIELRTGRDAAKAVAELRRYCGLDVDAISHASMQAEAGGLHERCLKAYALLVAERKDAEADAFIYDAYRMAARSRNSDDASLAGLAEIESRRGRSEEAARLLKLLVERSTDNLKALVLAAETAARINRLSDAIEFREQIARANPGDSVNKLELARAVAAAGRAGDAVDRIVALLGERSTPNRVRAQAAEVIGEISRADSSQSTRALGLLEQRATQGDAGALLARASIYEAGSRSEEARAALGRISGGPLAAVAQMKLAQIALVAGREPEAVTSFERAVYLDADGAITEALAFRAPGPRVQLIKLYGKTGRDLAAIQLAEGDEKRRPLMRGLLRDLSDGGQPGLRLTVSFEPSLEITRSKSAGLKTLAELSESATARTQSELLASLAESSARLGQFERAIAIERLLAFEATRAEEKTVYEKKLAEFVAAERARQLRAASLMRIDNSNTTESIYGARLIGN